MQKPVLSSVWGSHQVRGLWQGKGGAKACRTAQGVHGWQSPFQERNAAFKGTLPCG